MNNLVQWLLGLGVLPAELHIERVNRNDHLKNRIHSPVARPFHLARRRGREEDRADAMSPKLA
jgi:hypothetical protein